MRRGPIVGREPEIRRVRDLVMAASQGHGGVEVVIGGAGTGKTRLAMYAQQIATANGVRVITVRAHARNHQVVLQPMSDAVVAASSASMRPGSDSLTQFLPALALLHPAWRIDDSSDLVQTPGAFGEGIMRYLTESSGSRGTCLIMEDLHWADVPTLEVLEYMFDQAHRFDTSIICTARPRATPTNELLSRAAGAGITPMVLDRLPLPAAIELVSTYRRSTFLDDETLRLIERADGLPLFLIALASDEANRTKNFAALIDARLARLTPHARVVVEAGAVQGERFDLAILAAVTGDSLADVLGGIRDAEDEWLVRDVNGALGEFSHSLVQDAVQNQLSRTRFHELTQATAVHLRARWQSARDASDAVCSASMLTRLGDVHAASALLLEVADHEVASGSWIVADGLLAEIESMEAPKDVAASAALMHLRLAARGCCTHQLDEAWDSGLLAFMELNFREFLVEVLVLISRKSLREGRIESARSLLSVAESRVTPESPYYAEWLLLNARVSFAEAGYVHSAKAVRIANEAARVAQERGQHSLTAEALSSVAFIVRRNDLAGALETLEHALEFVADGQATELTIGILNEIGVIETHTSGREDRLLRAKLLATQAGTWGLLASINLNLTSAALLTGDLRLTQERALDAAMDAKRLGLQPLQSAAIAHLGAAMGLSGDLKSADVQLARATSIAGNDASLLGLIEGFRGALALEAFDVAAARGAFERSSQLHPAGSIDPAVGHLMVLDAVDGHAANGDLKLRTRDVQDSGQCVQMFAHYAGAVVFGRNGDSSNAMAEFKCGEQIALTFPSFRCGVLLLLSSAALRDSWGEPIVWLRELEQHYESVGNVKGLGAARQLLREAGEHGFRRAVAENLSHDLVRVGITAREAEVLELVTQMFSNREIAQRLFLSVRTVEKHVGQLISKLGVGNRRELARWVANG